jgi:hypothetical protein
LFTFVPQDRVLILGLKEDPMEGFSSPDRFDSDERKATDRWWASERGLEHVVGDERTPMECVEHW